MMIIKIRENLKDINWLVVEKLGMHFKETGIKSKIVEAYENYERKCHEMIRQTKQNNLNDNKIEARQSCRLFLI